MTRSRLVLLVVVRNNLGLSDETISAPGQGLDITRLLRGVAKRVSQSVHRRVQPLVVLNKRVRRPQSLAELFSCYQLPWPLQQQCQNLERLVRDSQPGPKFLEFLGGQIYLKRTKTNNGILRTSRGHFFERILAEPV